ncbi:hypothetical protein ACFQJC_06695 [Haloferax namakaokahaiae]|uniref:DUF2795 domain-containing protein n=1 Tax=Haloferax namakaokahaiae TaxID=1748331 RepID=A0ABD5ZD95_9EURY
MDSERPNGDPDPERVQDNALDRQHERAEHAERIYDQIDGLLGEQKYPTTGEELAVEYEDTILDAPNETETLGDVFDRLVDERFESETEAREAIINELTGRADGLDEYNDERNLSKLDTEGGPAG